MDTTSTAAEPENDTGVPLLCGTAINGYWAPMPSALIAAICVAVKADVVLGAMPWMVVTDRLRPRTILVKSEPTFGRPTTTPLASAHGWTPMLFTMNALLRRYA